MKDSFFNLFSRNKETKASSSSSELSVSEIIQDLEMSSSKMAEGFDINGNGRADVSDFEIDRLAKSLGWSPERLRELISSSGLDFNSLKTNLSSTSTSVPEGGGPGTDFSGLASFAPTAGISSAGGGGGIGGSNLNNLHFQAVNLDNSQAVNQLSMPQPEIPQLQASTSAFEPVRNQTIFDNPDLTFYSSQGARGKPSGHVGPLAELLEILLDTLMGFFGLKTPKRLARAGKAKARKFSGRK